MAQLLSIIIILLPILYVYTATGYELLQCPEASNETTKSIYFLHYYGPTTDDYTRVDYEHGLAISEAESFNKRNCTVFYLPGWGENPSNNTESINTIVAVTYGQDIPHCNAKNYYLDMYYRHCRELSPSNVWIPEWKEYLIEVAQEFIYEIEDFGLCNVPLQDYSENISRTYFGYELKGIVKYKNGFIGTMQEASLRDNGFTGPSISESNQTITIQGSMSLNDFIFYYDYFVYLTKGNFSGTVGVPFKGIEFLIQLIIHYDGEDVSVEGNLDLTSSSQARNQKWYYLPTNKYIEIINRQNKYDAHGYFKTILNTTWHTLLNNVLRKIPIPDNCFNCNSKTT